MKRIILSALIIICVCFPEVYADGNELYDSYCSVLQEKEKTYKDNYITRGEFTAVLMKHLGYTRDIYICSFYDVYETDWDYTYIANAQHRGIALGDGEHAFLSDSYLTIEDAVVFLSRAYRLDSEIVGEYSVNSVEGLSDYAKNYAGYAIDEKIFPQNNGTNCGAREKIRIGQALELILKYDKLSQNGFNTVKLEDGYPKISESGSTASVLVKFKTDKPCTVYYSVKEASDEYSDFLPQKEDVNTVLTSISTSNIEIAVNIKMQQQKSYDIFFVLADTNGRSGGIYALRDVSPLPFTLGKGTKNNPYKIYTAYQLNKVRNYPDKYFELCADIEYNDRWIPIGAGKNDKNFSGVFDGGGHSVTGLVIEGKDCMGMFSVLDGAEIKNLYVNARVSGENYAGIIAGQLNSGIISDCHAAGYAEAKENIAGGIAGKNSGIIENCVSAAYLVSADAYAGGIAGTNLGTVRNCLSAVEAVYADMYASSVAGVNSGGIVENCVGASIEAEDAITVKSGRITTNKEGGKTINNYAYSQMLAGDSVYIGENQQDGAEAEWRELTSAEFYKNKLKWSFSGKWTMEYAPDFMLPCLKKLKNPELIKGLTVYAPMGIENEEELLNIANNLGGHYYLKNDVKLTYKGKKEKYWTPLGISDEYGNLFSGFTGSLDGRGHTIKGLRLEHKSGIMQYGLFGVLYGGTVRNLSVTEVTGNVRGSVGVIAGVSYGTIENCFSSGKLNVYDRNGESVIGGICAINYTNIYSSDSILEIKADTESASIGGIAGNNEGFIYDCSYSSKIESLQGGKSSNVVTGGIAGSNYNGMIYNCCADAFLASNSNTGYCGGIAGLMNGGEIYKCSSKGRIIFEAEKKIKSYSYAGGAAGLLSGGLIMNTFSHSDIAVNSDKGYAGGIAGFCENASIQNVYSLNSITQKGGIYTKTTEGVFAGGIAGFCENTNISGSVSLNPYVITNGTAGLVCAYSWQGYIDNNYCYDKIYISAGDVESTAGGIAVDIKSLKNISFYFNSVADGGVLGWDNIYSGGDVWTAAKNQKYPFPVLNGVKNQNQFDVSAMYK